MSSTGGPFDFAAHQERIRGICAAYPDLAQVSLAYLLERAQTGKATRRELEFLQAASFWPGAPEATQA